MKADVLPSPDVPNEGLAINVCSEGCDNASIGDILKLILALHEVLYVITETLAGLAFASQEVPRGAWLSISPLKVIIECLLEVSPSLDRAFPKVV